jgi:hypothetical protein
MLFQFTKGEFTVAQDFFLTYATRIMASKNKTISAVFVYGSIFAETSVCRLKYRLYEKNRGRFLEGAIIFIFSAQS